MLNSLQTEENKRLSRMIVLADENIIQCTGIIPNIRLVKTSETAFAVQSSVFDKYQNHEQKEALKSIFRHTAFITRLSSIDLSASDIDDLLSANAIDDGMVNEYFKTIGFQNTQCHALASTELKEGQLGDFFSAIVNNVNNLSPHDQEKLEKIKTANILFLPFLVNGHWYLFIALKDAQNDYHLFTLDTINAIPVQEFAIENMARVLKAVSPASTIRTKKALIVPRQSGGPECGASVSFFASLISQDPNILFHFPNFHNTTCYFSQFRYHMAHMIAMIIAGEAKNEIPNITPTLIQLPLLQEENDGSNLALVFFIAAIFSISAYALMLALAFSTAMALTCAIAAFIGTSAMAYWYTYPAQPPGVPPAPPGSGNGNASVAREVLSPRPAAITPLATQTRTATENRVSEQKRGDIEMGIRP